MSEGSRFVLPYQTVIDATGVPLPGALLYFYESGTNTPLNTYSDQALTVPNTNPVVANAAGEFPNIFLLIENYKVVLTDSSLDQIWTADPVLGGPPLGGGTATLASATTVDLGSTTASLITISGTTTIAGFGTSALPGEIKALIFSGILTLTQSASLLLPNAGANITTAAGDRAWAANLGGGNWEILVYQKADGTALAASANTGAAQLLASAQGMNAPLNLRINATVSLNALTVSLKTAANADASAPSPILIPFRDPTLTNGDPIIASLQAAISFTVVAPNTMGAANGVPFRLWVIAYYNGGNIALGLFNASTATAIFGLPEGALVTTDASTQGGSSAGTHYANVSAVTNTPFRILGYMEWSAGLATAGSWTSVPTTIQLFGPGIKKPGDVVQSTLSTTGTVATGTTALPYDNTIPQITEGDQYMSLALAPTNAANILIVEVSAYGTNSAVDQWIGAVFQAGIAGALIAGINDVGNGNSVRPLFLEYTMIAASVSSLTFSFRAGAGSGTTTFNGSAGSQYLGGVLNSFIKITELMG